MKSFILLVLILLFCNATILAQCPQHLTFNTQEQINLFPVQHQGCESFTSLTITGNDIDDLGPLLGIKRIAGQLVILENPLLSNLKGLDSLVYAYEFTIRSNASLTSLEGLGSLDTVFNSIHIRANHRLKDMRGLENLSEMRSINIYENDSLENVNGLADIKKEVSVNFIKNPRLVSLHGLHNFESGELLIDDNDALTNLNGLDNLSSVLFLNIARNDNLQDILGLRRLEEIQVALSIYNNPKLSHCEIFYFCSSLFDPEVQTQIHSNSPSCISLDSIQRSCSLANSYAIGNVYLDLNCNQVFDDNDAALAQHILEAVETERPVAATSQTGNYIRYLFDEDTMMIRSRELNRFTSVPLSYEIITDTTFQVFDSLNFALCPDTLFYDLEISLTDYNLPRPGFSNSYQLCIQNKSTFVAGGDIIFDFTNAPSSDYVTIVGADGSGIINGTTVTWTIPNIPVFSRQCMNIDVEINPSTPLGTILFPQVTVSPIENVTEIDITNNSSAMQQTVVGSYDPNDKSVNHDRVDFNKESNVLEYIIRFQNTGTFPATFIEVIDTLENELDIRTFEMISASHPYTLSFTDPNILKWRFDNVNLPDSSSNEAGSHGFVRFKINTQKSLSLGTEILNNAAIYFDFNDPVITNATSTKVELQVNTEPSIGAIENISIIPNPNSGQFYLEFNLEKSTKATIEIFNSQGHILFSELLNTLPEGNNSIDVNPPAIYPGIYFVRILTSQGIVTKKMLVVQ